MLGICAESAERGVGALKDWVTALKLPRGRLHGMDEEGVPLDMSTFGSVYIKYSSKGGQVFEPGDANLNGERCPRASSLALQTVPKSQH